MRKQLLLCSVAAIAITTALSGTKTLEPNKLESSGSLTYKAPDEDDKKATAKLQSTSKRGIGTLVLDARRDGSEEIRGYTFPALVTTEKQDPKAAAAAVRAVVAAQKALKEDPDRATAVGRKVFPPTEAGLIAELIRRDVPFYDPTISKSAVESMNRFAQDIGLLSKPVPYEQVVWKP